MTKPPTERKLNVLIINTIDRRGGAAEVSWSIKTELENRGHKANLFVDKKYSDNKYVNIIPKNIFIEKVSYCLATDIDFWNSDKILSTKEFQNADIVHCHNLHGNYFKLSTLEKISKIKPVVWTFHDMWPITSHCAHSFGGKVKNGFFQCPNLNVYQKILWNNEKYLSWKKKRIYENSSFNIVVPSLWLKEKVGISILSDKPIQHIPNGIDTSIFHLRNKIKCRHKYNLPQDKKIILFVAAGGKTNSWKGWKYTESVISHFKKREDMVFVCIGGNESIKEKSNHIIHIPYVEDKNVLSEYFSSADIFLFTSIAENFPLVILEALGSGTPVVSFDVGGVKEVVTHKKNGYIAKYKNVKDLFSGVNYILTMPPDDLKKMSEVSSQKIKNKYSLRIMIDKYLKLYKMIIRDEKK